MSAVPYSPEALRKYLGSGSEHCPGGRESMIGVYSCTCWLTCCAAFSAQC